MRNNHALRSNLWITMGLQAIETTSPKDGNPFFLVDQNAADRTTAHWTLTQGVSFLREGASIAFAPNPLATGIQHRRGLPRNKQSRCTCICCSRSVCSVAFH